MEDYYPDEIGLILEEYAELNKASEKIDEEIVEAEDF